MQIAIAKVLAGAELKSVRADLADARFAEGRSTEGFAARTVKRNLQADDRRLEPVRRLISERILANEVFQMAVRPKALSPLPETIVPWSSRRAAEICSCSRPIAWSKKSILNRPLIRSRWAGKQ